MNNFFVQKERDSGAGLGESRKYEESRDVARYGSQTYQGMSPKPPVHRQKNESPDRHKRSMTPKMDSQPRDFERGSGKMPGSSSYQRISYKPISTFNEQPIQSVQSQVMNDFRQKYLDKDDEIDQNSYHETQHDQ
jgi:hypothetical protein